MTIPHDASWFHPARAAKLGLGPKKIVAEFGELHPKVTKALGLKGRIIAFSLFLDALPFPKSDKAARAALQLNDLQSVARDFAFVVDHDVPAQKLLNAVRGADKKLIADVQLFDIFEGDKAEAQFGAGKKSMALTVHIEPQGETLKDADLKTLSDTIISKAEKAVGATLRS